MTVIEFAEKRLNESCLNDDDEAVLYWRAYLDGARAQKKEYSDRMGKCAECKHHDIFGVGSGCNLMNNGERCKFEPMRIRC